MKIDDSGKGSGTVIDSILTGIQEDDRQSGVSRERAIQGSFLSARIIRDRPLFGGFNFPLMYYRDQVQLCRVSIHPLFVFCR
jgi:hypothetical protein